MEYYKKRIITALLIICALLVLFLPFPREKEQAFSKESLRPHDSYYITNKMRADKQITKISQYSLKELGYIHTESLSEDTWDELKAIVDQFYAK